MKKKHFLFPWQKQVTLVCPQCNGKIQTLPLWPSEKPEDKIRQLQPFVCHMIDVSLIKQAPVLSENDVKCAQKQKDFLREFINERGEVKTGEDTRPLFTSEKGPPEIFLRHGVFPLLRFFTETSLKVLYFFLCLDPKQLPYQRFFLNHMKMSRSSISAIITRLRNWKLVVAHRAEVKGRANGRQLCYGLSTVARQRLDKDLMECDFFRETVKKTVRPIALNNSQILWRTDIGLLTRENE